MTALIRLFPAALCLAALAQTQSSDPAAVLKPGDNLVVEGIPPIPSKLAEDVGRFTEFRYAGLSSWHPERREMLIGTRFANVPQIHLVKMPGGARTQLTFYQDGAGGARFRPKRGDCFVFAKDAGGNEFYQLYRYDLANGAVTLLTDGKSRNTGHRWSNNGDRLAYGSTRRTGDDVDVWVVKPDDPKTDRLLTKLQGGGWRVLDWAPGDRKLLLAEEISANESNLWLLESETGEKTALTPKGGPKVLYSGALFSKDGKGIYVTTDKESEFQRLTYIDLVSGQHTFLTMDIPWDISEFDLSEDGRTLAFVANEDGFGTLHLLDIATRKKTEPKLPAGTVYSVLWHKNGRDLGFGLDSARTSGDVYSLDVKTGKVDRWTSSETGGLVTDQFSEPELIHWKSFDGLTISGFLYKPPARFTGKRAVVIDIHGGPEGQFAPGFMSSYNYFLEELGVALIFPNVRGSTGYGKTFLALDNGFLRENSYRDINALLDWIGQRSDLDSSRIMVTGGSYGGFMTLAVATNYDDRIRCSLDVVGPSNFVTFLENTSGYRRDLRRVEYGDERDPKMREFLERIAPANNALKIHKPLFIVASRTIPECLRASHAKWQRSCERMGRRYGF